MSPGHVFVVRGDMTKLVCDHVLVTTDYRLEIGKHWGPLLPADLLQPGSYMPLSVALKRPRRNRVVPVPQPALKPRPWLVVTGAGGARPASWVADGIVEALDAIRADPGETKRSRPLVALPLPGTGAGGMAGRRGEVIDVLLPRLREATTDGAYDVVLVLRDQADWAAVQAQRTDDDFSELSPAQRKHGDRLAEHAHSRELALFLGPGVSLRAGLPTWKQLLADLAVEARLDPERLAEVDPQDAAEVARSKLGEKRFRAYMVERFTRSHHTLTHGLLASLGVGSAVTTNYDTCYELATEGAFADHRLRVLPRQHSRSSSPWLLKLHGDVLVPKSIVLTREKYLDLAAHGVPLIGMVQSLLLTGHVLIVGYSLSDENVIRLAHQVRQVLAQGVDKHEPVGTLLPLVEDPIRERLWRRDLHHVPMQTARAARTSDERDAARLLEIFLDRLAWRTAVLSTGSEQYLLDRRYEAVSRSAADIALRKSIRRFLDELSPEARKAPAGRCCAMRSGRSASTSPTDQLSHAQQVPFGSNW